MFETNQLIDDTDRKSKVRKRQSDMEHGEDEVTEEERYEQEITVSVVPAGERMYPAGSGDAPPALLVQVVTGCCVYKTLLSATAAEDLIGSLQRSLDRYYDAGLSGPDSS